MRVKEIRIYPIKSLRGISLQSQQATVVGLQYDRIFMLQRVQDEKHMDVSHFPSMCLFTTELSPSDNPTKLLVRYSKDHTFDQPDKKLSPDNEILEVLLEPDVSNLERRDADMHGSVAKQAFVMPEQHCRWFSDRLGFEVRLFYIGHTRREVLGNQSPLAKQTFIGDSEPPSGPPKRADTNSWLGSMQASVGSIVKTAASYAGMESLTGIDEGLTFTDLAAFLVVSEKSFEEVQKRMGGNVDIEKFRPNIVIEGSQEAFEEDFWRLMSFTKDKNVGIVLTQNCSRCTSLNVDYSTGKFGEGQTGGLLKSLQKDRRIDPGDKYAPIFGRYGFLATKNGARLEKPVMIHVGDEVEITKNDRRTHLYWPGAGSYKNEQR